MKSPTDTQAERQYSEQALQALSKSMLAYTQRQLARIQAEYEEDPLTLTHKQWLPIAKNYIEDVVANRVFEVLQEELALQEKAEPALETPFATIKYQIRNAIEVQNQILNDLREKRHNLIPLEALNASLCFGKVEILKLVQFILEHPDLPLSIEHPNLPLSMNARKAAAVERMVHFKIEEIIFTHSLTYWAEYGASLVETANEIVSKQPVDMQRKLQKHLENPVESGLISEKHGALLSDQPLGMLSLEGFRAFIQTRLDECHAAQAKATAVIYEPNNTACRLTPVKVLTLITSDTHQGAQVLNSHRNVAKFVVSNKVTQAGDTTTMKGYKKLLQALNDNTLEALGEDYQPLPEVPTPDTVVRLAVAFTKAADREKYLASHYSIFVKSKEFSDALKRELLDLVTSELRRYEGEFKKLKDKDPAIALLKSKQDVLISLNHRLLSREEPILEMLNLMLDAKNAAIGTILWTPRGGGSTPEIITKLQELQALVTTPGRAHLSDLQEVKFEQTNSRKAKALFGRLFGKSETLAEPASQSSAPGLGAKSGDASK